MTAYRSNFGHFQESIQSNRSRRIQNVSSRKRLLESKENDIFSIQEVRYIKEEVNVDTDNESLAFEMADYSDYESTNINDEITDDISTNELKKYYAECVDLDLSSKQADDLATLYDLIDFTCTKCRTTSKKAVYFLSKTDVQCPDCQATMKFQCPRCKLLFRKFDSACRHAKQICQIDDDSSPHHQPQMKSTTDFTRTCSECGYSTPSTIELRRHFRHEHPEIVRSTDNHICWLCGRRYKSRESMLKHARLCGRAPHIRCEFCDYRTKRQEHLRVHMRHRHPDPESCHGSTYDCPNCHKQYKYLTSMKSHAKNCGKPEEKPLLAVATEQPSTSTQTD